MHCYICGSKKDLRPFGRRVICQECYNKGKDYFIMKCTNCGYYGFIPKTLENIDRVSMVTHRFLEAMLDQPIVLEFPYCPNCQGRRPKK